MKILALLSALILLHSMPLSVAQAATAATAPDIASQPCDTQYWKQMSARAWMEAEREIMQNKNLIFKPDSVLEYVCFDQFVNIAAFEGGDIFTHTKYFGQEIIKRASNEALHKSLNNVVYASLIKYINNSFGHDFLGGRAGGMSITNKDSQFQAPSGPSGYTCKTMKHVWKAAKCSNFVDNANFENTDGFYPFATIKGHNGTPDVAGYDDIQEVRQWPSSCGAEPSFGPAGSWQQQINLASNMKGGGGDKLYKFKEPLAAIYEEVGDKLEPGNCNVNTPIKTGIKVIVNDKESYDDAVCTNPGCVYNKTGNCIKVPVTGSGSLVTDDDDPALSGGAG